MADNADQGLSLGAMVKNFRKGSSHSKQAKLVITPKKAPPKKKPPPPPQEGKQMAEVFCFN